MEGQGSIQRCLGLFQESILTAMTPMWHKLGNSLFKNMTPNLRVNLWLGSNYNGSPVPLGAILRLPPGLEVAPAPTTEG